MLETVTRYSKFCEQREQRIWEKQFGELFCSIFVSYKSPVQLFSFVYGWEFCSNLWRVLVVASSISFKITLSYFSLIPLLRLSKSVVQQCVRFCITFKSVYWQYKSHRFLTDGFVLCQPKSYAAYTYILLVYKKQKETVFLPSPIALFQCQIEKAVLV